MTKEKRIRLPKPIPTGKRERNRLDRDAAEAEYDGKIEGLRVEKIKREEKKARATNAQGTPVPLGRPKGVPNRTTAYLRQIIFMAGELEGSNQKGKDGLLGYVRALARYEKKTYVMLLAKCLPQKIQADMDPNGLMARMLQAAAATRSAREGQQNGPVIDVTPALPRPPPK